MAISGLLDFGNAAFLQAQVQAYSLAVLNRAGQPCHNLLRSAYTKLCRGVVQNMEEDVVQSSLER